MSVAGGLEKATELAKAAGCTTVQIFTKNNNQWRCKPLEPAQVDRWRAAVRECGLFAPIAHASYLINLASPDEALWQKSIDALQVEWERGEQLRLEGLVVHPGAYTSSSESAGQRRIRDAIHTVIDRVQPRRCRLLLENTAGQGSCLGYRIEQLGWLLDQLDAPRQLGVCIDTCHAFAAGYEIHTEHGFREFKRELNGELPRSAIRALHLNDSKKPCGSRVDRHEHIGAGEIGEEGFRLVLNDAKLGKIPGYLETPKGTDEASGADWDKVNLKRLHALID